MAAQTPNRGIPNPIPGITGPILPIPGFNNGPSNPLTPIKDVAEFLTKLTDPNFYVRAAEFGAGMLLLAIGVFVVVKGPQHVQSANRTATKVVQATPQGRAATVARKAQTAGKVAQHREIGRAVGRAQGRQAAKAITR